MSNNWRKIILGGITIAAMIILAAAAFGYKNYQEKNINLISYAPEGASAWTLINLDSQELTDYFENKKEVKSLMEDYLTENGLPASLWQGGAQIKKLMLIELPINKKKENVWVVHTEQDASELVATSIEGYYFASLDKQVAVLSKSKEAIKKISERKPFDNFSQRGKRRDDYLVLGYIKISELVENAPDPIISGIGDIKAYLAVDEYLVWRVYLDQNKLINFEINCAVKKNIWENSNKNEEQAFYDIENVIAIKNIAVKSLAEKFFVLPINNEIPGSESQVDLENRFEEREKESYTLFEQPGVLILKPKVRLTSLSEAVNINNYFYGYAIETAGLNKNVAQVMVYGEEILRNYLAFKYPMKRIKILPDKTKGVELVANPEAFEWRIWLKDNRVKILKYNNSEYSYGFFDKRFVFGNSASLVELIGKAKLFRGIAASGDLLIDMDIIDSKYSQLGEKLRLASENTGKEITINGKFEERE